MFWKARIKRQQKLGLGAVFSLTVITMVFAIVRVAAVSSYGVQPDPSWLWLWSAIEMSMGMLP